MLLLPITDGAPTEDVDLDGTDEADTIVRVKPRCCLGIDLSQTTVQGAWALLFFSFQLCSKMFVARRAREESLPEDLDVETGASHDEYISTSSLNLRDGLFRTVAELSNIEALVWCHDVDQVVWHACPLFECGLGASDIQATIDLARIGVDDFRTETIGKLDSQFCLSRTGRADQSNDHAEAPSRRRALC